MDKKKDNSKVKILFLFLILIIGFILVKYTPISEYANKDFLINSRTQLRALSETWYFPLAFILIYATGVIISFPGLILTLAGGIIFGTAKGTLVNVIASNLGASCAFFIARYLGRDFTEKLIKGKLKSIDENLGENGFIAVLRLRLIPLVPFNLLNYAVGFSKVKYKDYALGSFLGMIPGTFIYTFFADAILIDPAQQKEAFIKLITAVSLLIALSFLPNIIKKVSNKKEL
ncbi:MAG: TVP38/TMEM64 family protein, partial [Cyanobacteriota bacterium]